MRSAVAFLIFTALGSLIWTGLLAGAGYLLQGQYDAVAVWIDPASTIVIVGLIGVYLYRLVRQFLRRREAKVS